MKKYTKPEFDAIMYNSADVLLESNGDDNNQTNYDDIVVSTDPQ